MILNKYADLKTNSDFWSAVLFLALGTLGIILSTRYDLGQLRQLGAGAFPFGVSFLLAVSGVALLFKSFKGSGIPVLAPDLGSLVSIVAALLIAGLTVRTFGIVIAVPAAVVVSSLASGQFRPVRMAVMAASLTLFCYLVFILGLAIRLPVYPGHF